MKNRTILIAGVLCGILLILLLPGLLNNETPEPTVEEVVVTEPEIIPEPEPLPEPEQLPVIEQPEVAALPAEIPEPEPVVIEEPEPEPIELPELSESDIFIVEQINTLENSNAVLQLMASENTIRKVAMLVENMRQGDIPARDLPFLGPRTELTATEQGETMYEMQPSSYDRFDEIVNTFVNTDTEQLVAMYYLFRPLLEQAYAELGIRNMTFDDALSEAIDQVLSVRVSGAEVLLLRPSVQYTFEDERLENASGVEKLLVRMGPSHARAIQDKVREIKAALED